MFNRIIFENSLPDGIAVVEVVNGTRPTEFQLRQFVPLKRTELTGQVDGPLASLRLTQTYGYSRKQCERVLEAVYRFPLPGDAAVTGVRVRFGDVEIQADLMERKKAEETYEEACSRDLILLDLTMPGMDGREVLAALACDQELSRIPVVVLTSATAEEAVLRSYELNANCYITKPVDHDAFLKVVAQIDDFWLRIVRLPPRV